MSTKAKEHKKTAESTVTIEHLGVGQDARTVAHVGTWDLTAFTGRGDEEPRASIADLAKRVGKPAIKLREIARRLRSENFNPLELSSERIGATPAFTELYLSEAEALYLMTRLRTPQAEAITWEMIRVYMLARRGLLRPSNDTAPAWLAPLAQAIVKLTETQDVILSRLVRLEERVLTDVGVVGATVGAQTRARLRRLSNVAVGAPPNVKLCPQARAHLRKVENLLRAEIDFVGKGCSWDNVQKGRMARVLERKLAAAETAAIEEGRGKADPRQLRLKAIK